MGFFRRKNKTTNVGVLLLGVPHLRLPPCGRPARAKHIFLSTFEYCFMRLFGLRFTPSPIPGLGPAAHTGKLRVLVLVELSHKKATSRSKAA